MGLKFRRRDYRAEDQVHSLSRVRAHTHPLSAPSSSPLLVEGPDCGTNAFFDPLRDTDGAIEVVVGNEDSNFELIVLDESSAQLRATKEWNFLRRFRCSGFLFLKLLWSLDVQYPRFHEAKASICSSSFVSRPEQQSLQSVISQMRCYLYRGPSLHQPFKFPPQPQRRARPEPFDSSPDDLATAFTALIQPVRGPLYL